MNSKIIILISILLLPVIIIMYLYFSGDINKDYIPPNVALKLEPVTLEYWKVWDESDVFADIINEFQQKYPNIKINYKKFRYDEYEKELIESFATDKGPDVFSLHNTWMKKYQENGFIASMPNNIVTISIQKAEGVGKKVEYKENNHSYSLAKLEKDFVDVVYDDVVIKEKKQEGQEIDAIFGLPLFVDTLAMYYNKELFNNADINTIPKYWNREFLQDVKKLTKQNNKGELIQSGVALGGSSNIERSADIISLLMMQNGTKMMNGKYITFHTVPESLEKRSEIPGVDALRFYTDFSNLAKEVYSWNNTLDNSLDMFIRGKVAMMFGYAYMLPQIKASAPELNFSISSIPQIEGNNLKINFANYWIETVSNKILTDPDDLKKGEEYAKAKQEAAWVFVQFITQKEIAKKYCEKVKKPSALRELVGEQTENKEIGIFASQVLTSKSWYKGNDSNSNEKIINEMIKGAVEETDKSIEEIISIAAQRVQQTIK